VKQRFYTNDFDANTITWEKRQQSDWHNIFYTTTYTKDTTELDTPASTVVFTGGSGGSLIGETGTMLFTANII